MNVSRWKWIALSIGTGLVLLMLAMGWLERHRGEKRLEEVRRALLAKGAKFTWQEIAPPPPPPDENGYGDMMQAMAGFSGIAWATDHSPRYLLTTNGRAILWQHVPRWRISTEFPNVETNQVTWEQWRAHLASMKAPLDEARAAINKPYLDGRPNYAAGIRMPLPHLAPIKRVANCLSAQANSDLQAGHLDDAVENLESMLRLARHLSREPLLISQLVQIAIQAMSIPVTWQLIHSRNLNSNQLARLQRSWTEDPVHQALASGLVGERVFNLNAFDLARAANSNFLAIVENSFMNASATTPTDFFEFVAAAGPQTGRSARALLWRHIFWPGDQAFMFESVQSMIEIHEMAARGKSFKALSSQLEASTNALLRLRDQTLFGNLRTTMSELVSPSLTTTLRRGNRAECQRRLAITAIALQRHYLSQGRYPTSLEALVPAYLSSSWTDPYDGQPLRYTCLGTGEEFRLYSVGEDLVDDGGRIEPKSPSTRRLSMWQAFTGSPDVVWPMPAGEAEARSMLSSEGE